MQSTQWLDNECSDDDEMGWSRYKSTSVFPPFYQLHVRATVVFGIPAVLHSEGLSSDSERTVKGAFSKCSSLVSKIFSRSYYTLMNFIIFKRWIYSVNAPRTNFMLKPQDDIEDIIHISNISHHIRHQNSVTLCLGVPGRHGVKEWYYYCDVMMIAMASQITSASIVCSTVCSHVNQRKHQSSASLAFVRGIHRWPVNSPHKGPVTRKMFPFDDVII